MPDVPSRAELLAGLADARATLEALLPRFSDAQWHDASRADGWTAHDIVAHIADSSYALARMTLGEIQPVLPLNTATNWMDASDLNEQRRQQNRTLSREKLIGRLASALGHAERAISTIDDYAAPGPYGPVHTSGQWLQRIIDHNREHTAELSALL